MIFDDGVKRKAFGYIRVSTEEQVTGTSLESQHDIIQDFADHHNLEIVEWFEDPGYSAKDANRPGLKRMKEVGKELKNEVDYILVYNYTRISRDLESYFVDIKRPFDACGIRIFSVTEPVDFDSPLGEMAAYFPLIGGEMDNRRKSQTSKDDMRAVANQGWYQARPPVGLRIKKIPIGIRDKYGKEKCRATLEADPNNDIGEKVALILNRFSDGDITQAEACRMAQKLGIKGRKGGAIQFDTLKRMLKNPAYAGYICSKKLTKSEMIKIPHFDGLITLETFNKNQRVLDGSIKELKPSDDNMYPLKKTLICSICDTPLRASAPTGGSDKPSPRYHCCKQGHSSLGVVEMHELFNEFINQITPTDRMIKLTKEILKRTALRKLGDTNREIEKLNKAKADIDSLIQKALAAYLNNEMSLEEKNSFLEAQNSDKKAIESKLKELAKIQNIN